MDIKKVTGCMLTFFGTAMLMATSCLAATYYVRPDGGTSTQCTGLADKAYPGTGTLQACAFNHPNWALAPQGYNPSKLVGGDTLIIDGSNGAQYMLGYGSPNTADTSTCYSAYTYDCYSRAVPSGPDAAHPTRILGKGWDSGCAQPPQLWGNERVSTIINLNKSNNVELQCLEVTDHSDCQQRGPNACKENYPSGPWASRGIQAADSSNVLIKNVNIHGLAHTGVLAGRLKDWMLVNTNIVANSFVGWNGDIGADQSSNSGTMLFENVKIQYNGCGETYPGKQPYNCYGQSQGGYGDGLGTHRTGGNWIFNNSNVSHNVSDGIDLLYHDGNGQVTVKRTRAEGNAGNQVKSATTTTIDNSVIVGNCAYFRNNPMAWTPKSFDNCRAGGNAIAVALGQGRNVTITNSTITSNGDTLIMSSGTQCTGKETIKSLNNIFVGGPDVTDVTGSDTSALYYAAGGLGNGDGACGQIKLSDDYSIIYGTKYNAAECQGKAHSQCVDPKFAEAMPNFYSGTELNVSLSSNSPALNKGLIISGASSLDYNGFDRLTSWDIGAVEFGSKPLNKPNESIVFADNILLTPVSQPSVAPQPAPTPVPASTVKTPAPTVISSTWVKFFKPSNKNANTYVATTSTTSAATTATTSSNTKTTSNSWQKFFIKK